LQYAADDEARYCPTPGGQRRTTSIRVIGRIGIESIQLCLSCLKNLENCDVTDVASSELADCTRTTARVHGSARATSHLDIQHGGRTGRCSFRLMGGVFVPDVLAAQMDESQVPASP
jgi:hypothetical protein